MNPVVHFEMPYEDRDRMASFYEKAFGWKKQLLGEEMGNYVSVETSEVDPQTHFPTQTGRINGGFFKRSPENQHPSVVIAVENIREAMKRIEEEGGTLAKQEPDEIPGIGLYVSFTDTEGNRVSLLEPHRS